MITFHGITDLGDDNLGEPFLGVVSEDWLYSDRGLYFCAGMVTGDKKDILDMYVDRANTLEEWEKLHETTVERITYQEACRRKLEWLLEKLAGKKSVKWETRDGGFIEFEIPLEKLQKAAAGND